jgi:hypothetical protein
MEAGPNLRRPNATNVFVMLLAAALLLGTLLFFLVLRPTGSGPVFTVSEEIGTTCPLSERSPACFELTVLNTGTESANVRCEVAAAAGNTAAFFSGGGPVYLSTVAIEPDVPLALFVKVDVTDGNDTAYAPNVSCGPA